jgi:aldose sugar dehydrogenase
MFVGDVNTGSLYHFKLNQLRDGLSLTGPLADKVANTLEESQQAALGHGFGTITDLQVGPDGYLYVITFAGSLYRIVPSSSSSNSLTPHDKVSETSDNSSPGVLRGGPKSDNNNDNTSSNHNTKKNPKSTTPGKLVEKVEPISIVGGSRK